MTDETQYLESLKAARVRLEQLNEYVDKADALAKKHFQLFTDALSAGRAYRKGRAALWKQASLIQQEVLGRPEYHQSPPIDGERLRMLEYTAKELGLPWDKSLAEAVTGDDR